MSTGKPTHHKGAHTMLKLSKASKMPCRSWSLQALDTCPASRDATGSLVPACSGCYATTGNYRFKNVKAPREHNREDWKRDAWEDDMVAELDNDRYFRWFDSGDMNDIRLATLVECHTYHQSQTIGNTDHYLALPPCHLPMCHASNRHGYAPVVHGHS